MKRLAIASILGTAVIVLNFIGYAHAQTGTNKKPQTSRNTGTTPPKPLIPNWLLKDIQIAEHANLSIGSNYTLYYGGTNWISANEMTHAWYGVYSGTGSRMDFGTNLQVVYKTLKRQPREYGPLSRITVMERTWQNKTPIGRLVPAVAVDVQNGDYLAFSGSQIITATDHAGYVHYTVFSVKGIKI